jgi:hypothetical protein
LSQARISFPAGDASSDVSEFVEGAKARGLVAEFIAKNDVRGLSVAATGRAQ